MKVIVIGPRGKMGKLITQVAASRDDMELVGAIAPKGRDYIGKDLGTVAMTGFELGVPVTDDLENIIDSCDVIIDFSTKEMAMEVLDLAIAHKKALVCGSTGFSAEEMKRFEEAGLTAGEEQTLESRRKVLANASTIRDRVAKAHALLSGDDDTPGAVDLLGEASNAMDTAAQLDESLSGVSGTLMDLYYSAKDAAAELIDRLDAYDTNDAELDEIEQRLDLLYRLKRKYGDTVEDIIAFGQKAREELEQIQFSEQRHDQLQAEKLRLYGLAREKAEALTQTRLKAFDELNARITDTLQFLNMPGVRMTLHHARGPLASHGQDSVEFYISTNAGEAPKPLARIASGGELSRITLAIKNALADRDAVPTVIYDEIDSGVSGKAAGRIGEVLRQSAQGHQILCITHTAQIAALADCHLLIQKNVTNDRTYTEIHPLDTEGRVEALARLISGDHVTELSRANAREMLQERSKA